MITMPVKLHPYLNFMGHTKAAMTFYHSVFGGDLTMQTYGESGMSNKPEERDLIMHADLHNGDLSFFAADGNAEHQVHMGDNVQMSLVGSEDVLLTKYFNGLAEGGHVDMPLEKAPWGDTFGMLTDKFGIHWMVNISGAAQK